ncbi:MAG: hypothetical protein ABFE01_16415 [Phycisphaerales bacterium]
MSTLRKLGRHRVGHRKSPIVERIPYGYARKMSDVIVELAQPLIDQAMNPEQFQMAISLASLCWNLSLAPTDEQTAMVNDALRELVKPGESIDHVRQIMASLVARKEALFPNDRRVITDCRVSGGPKNADIVIEYSPPEQV